MKLINERPRENKGGVNVSWDLRFEGSEGVKAVNEGARENRTRLPHASPSRVVLKHAY